MKKPYRKQWGTVATTYNMITEAKKTTGNSKIEECNSKRVLIIILIKETRPHSMDRATQTLKEEVRLVFHTEFFSFDFPTPCPPHPVITLNNLTAEHKKCKNIL